MGSRLSAAAAALGESGILLAVLLLPGYFNVYSEQTFEFDKALLLRSLAGVVLAGLLIHVAEERGDAWRTADGTLWRRPMVLAVLTLTAAHTLATLCSVALLLSWLGSHQRAQGLWTWLSYLTVFVAAVGLVRRRDQVDRVVTALLLGAVAPAWYAIVQRLGADPIDWGFPAAQRATSTAGNAIFLGAMLIMVLPFAVARALLHLAPGYLDRAAAPRRVGRGVTYLALSLLYGLGLLYSNSRGPMLGFGVGTLVLAALVATIAGRRSVVLAAIGLSVAGSAALLWIRLNPTHAEPPTALRVGQMLNLQEGSGRVRVLLWESAGRLVTQSVGRALVGYGPETALVVFHRVYPPELAGLEQSDVTPDRAHNGVLDALVSGGLVQAAAEVGVFVVFVATALRRIGMLGGAPTGALFAAALVLGATAGALGPFVVTGAWHLSVVGGALGLVGGVLAYVVGVALRSARPTPPPTADALLVAAMCAAGCAHFAEIQVGLATTTPRLYFILTTALLVCMTSGTRLAPSAVARPRQDAAIVGVLTGLLLATIQFDLRTPGVNLAIHGPTLASGLLLVWLVGGAVLGGDAVGPRRSSWRSIATYTAISAGLWGLFALVHTRWLAWVPPSGLDVEASARLFGAHLSALVTLYYGAVGLGLGLLAGVLAYRDARGLPIRVRAGTPLAAGVLAGASLALVLTNLHAVHADCLTKLGKSYEARGRWREAVSAHAAALEAAPSREEYAVNLSRVLIERARRAGDAAARNADAERATALAAATARADPLNPDHPANLARIERKWARTVEPNEKAPHLQRAASAYAQALALAPTNPAVWSEVAVFELERGNPAAARERFTHAITLAPAFVPTYALRAQAALTAGDHAAAIADFRRARQLVTNHPNTRQNLARLYQRIALLDHALAEARAARATAGTDEAIQADAFIASLEAARAAPPVQP